MSDQSYKPYPYSFTSKGLVAYYAIDKSPPDTYWDLQALEVRQDGALSSVLGRVALTTDGTNNFPITVSNPPTTDPVKINTLGGLQSTAGTTYRYAAGYDPLQSPPSETAGIWRRTGITGGAFTLLGDPPLAAGFPFFTYSGNRMSMVTYRPSFSGTPYIYFADSNSMVKDNGTFNNVKWWGVLPPWGFVVAVVQPALNLALTSVATAAGGLTVYTGTITGGAGNAFAGITFSVAGFTNAVNDVVNILCVASTSTTLTLQNPFGIAETHAATATQIGPNVNGNGNNYDYRLTLYNQNTGDESNPTAEFVQANNVSPVNQSVLITWPSSTFAYQDTQATHFRIYRRGGTLTGATVQGVVTFNGWLLIATIPVSSTSYLDSFPDFQIADNDVLEIDNDPPCTTSLPSQYNSTTNGFTAAGLQTILLNDAMPGGFFRRQVVVIDVGANQEIVLVDQPFNTTQFSAYFQLNHLAGAPVVISTRPEQGMNLAAMAFEQAFLAGDPNNPSRLYYSKVQQPSAFPPVNFIEISVPSDPIMAVVGIRGQIFVFTQSRVFRVLNVGTGVPDAIPTGSRHGLFANFAWAIGEQGIYYLSFDGVYLFSADDSIYVSESVEWLLANKQPNLGPVNPILESQRANAIAAYCKGEFFLAYSGNPSPVRLIYDTVHKRWRNDVVPCDAMYFDEGSGNLFISQDENGMVYQDRVGDWYQEGFIAGVLQSVIVPAQLQTPMYDQGLPRNDKIYNELMIDVDSGGNLALGVFLLFDYGVTVLNLGPLTLANGRQQVTIPINAGAGQVSRNVGIILNISVIPGAENSNGAAHFYGWQIKAAVDAEQRKSYDSYWSKMGTDEFKFVKQGYFEYSSPGAAIAFNVYLEGQATPAYSFVLPQSTTRTAVKIRFPAFKAKLWRFTALSTNDFKLYGQSFVEFKPITTDKSYGKMPFGQITAQGGV